MSGGRGKTVRRRVRATKFITLALVCSLGIGLSSAFGLGGSTTDPSVSLTICPSDDAFVSSMFPDNTSVRTEDYVDIWDLWVGREWISALSVVRVNRAFLKFDLSSMIPDGAEITSARLRLYRVGLALQTETTGAPMVQCYAAGDDWDENTITWNAQPSVGAYLDSYENVPFWNSWDVTSFVQGEFGGDKLARFMLMAKDEATQETSSAIFPSKEYDGYGPRLEVIYEPPRGAREVKLDVLEELNSLRDLVVDPEMEDRLNNAISSLSKSLEERWWIDNFHINAPKVFDREKKVTEELMEVAKRAQKLEMPEVVAKCQELAEALVSADETLAKTALDEAKATPGAKPKEIAKAEKELTKAYGKLEEMERGMLKIGISWPKYNKAVDHFKHVWEHAQRAIS